MKRLLGILVLALLLTGCTAPEPAPSTEPTANTTTQPPSTPSTPTQPTEPQPDTDNTVPLNAMALDGDFHSVVPMGNRLLLIGEDLLRIYTYGIAQPTASAAVPNLPSPDSGLLQVSDTGIVYYDAAERAIVYLDEQLQTVRQRKLEEQILGDPYLAPDQSKLYFCTAAGIRIWDLELGVYRNLKLQEGNWQGIHGALLDGAALRCSLMQPDGTLRTLLISTQTGKTIHDGSELLDITTSGQLYCYPTQSEWIFGLIGQRPQLLNVPNAIPLLRRNAALNVYSTESGIMLELYDLISGRRTASLSVPGIAQANGLNAFDGYLWFLADGTLYRWDPSLSPVADETDYTTNRYTADNPDTEGLANFQARADALKSRYGIEILIWNDAATAEPAGYTFEIEYRTEIYEAAFATLEKALSQFPDSMPDRAADWTTDGTLRIVLVRSITTPSETAYTTLPGMEYLLDGKVYIVLEMGDHLERSFYHTLFHVIDPLVLSNSIAYYKWNDLNPSGFQYDNDYIANLNRDSSKYLEDGQRYFIDTYAMSFGVEDRARIFEYAMMSGNESYFTSAAMQGKLKMLCKGLREVFGLTGTYTWEQYLT